MAEEGTLGLVRAQDTTSDQLSKEELQRRMDEARDSISQTVTEIKDTVVHQYESVKDTISETLDWREQFKKRPVAWSLGAAGAGFVAGYGIAAMIKGESNGYDRHEDHYLYEPSGSHVYASQPIPGTAASRAQSSRIEAQEEESGPGLMERIQETQAFDRLRTEASAIGNRFVDEVSKTAQQILLPAAVGLIRGWLERLIPEKSSPARPGVENSQLDNPATQAGNRPSYQPVLERNE